MAPRFIPILIGPGLPRIRQVKTPEPPIINTKTIANFARVVEQTGILERRAGAKKRTIYALERATEVDP
jgi:hypothetical protein